MGKLHRTAFLVFLCEILLTATFYVPLYFVEWIDDINHVFNNHFGANAAIVTPLLYALAYAIIFVILYLPKSNREIAYIMFALIHYVLMSSLLFMAFAKHDGQAVLLIYVCCFLSALMVWPMAYIWREKKQQQ